MRWKRKKVLLETKGKKEKMKWLKVNIPTCITISYSSSRCSTSTPNQLLKGGFKTYTVIVNTHAHKKERFRKLSSHTFVVIHFRSFTHSVCVYVHSDRSLYAFRQVIKKWSRPTFLIFHTYCPFVHSKNPKLIRFPEGISSAPTRVIHLPFISIIRRWLAPAFGCFIICAVWVSGRSLVPWCLLRGDAKTLITRVNVYGPLASASPPE